MSGLNRLISWMLPAIPKAVVGRVARRYIAGESRVEALDLAERLRERGYVTTLDVLGEDIDTAEEAGRAADTYIGLLASLAASNAARNISIKLTQLGLRIDFELALAELRRVLESAAEHDATVRIDMEDSSLTDATLELHDRARRIWPRVGTVLQARLRRTADDARRLAETGARIRLCKGIYREPERIAYTGREEIRESFLETARILLDGGVHTALATHDVPLLNRLYEEVEKRSLPADRYEVQALLGVPIRSVLERARDAGRTVRIYVPYGRDWYAYSMRRLAENPDMAGAIARSLFSRDRMDASRTNF